jgi:hypothetical protein
VLLLFSLGCRVQLGIRLQLPLVLFWYGLLAYWVPNTNAMRPARSWLLALTFMMQVYSLAVCYPHGLVYVNRFWGGPDRYAAGLNFVDSNQDWGQDLPELKRWHEQHGQAARLCLWYYGTDPLMLLPPFDVMLWHQEADADPQRFVNQAGGRQLAVSRSMLAACPDRRPATLAFVEQLKATPPHAVVGCFNIYTLANQPCEVILPMPGSSPVPPPPASPR